MCRYVIVLAVGYAVVCVCVCPGQYVVPVPTAAGPACMVRLELLPQRVTAAEENKTFFFYHTTHKVN